MPNRLLLPENFSKYNFVALSKKEPNPKNRLRLIAMSHIQDGKTLKVVASYVKVHWKSVLIPKKRHENPFNIKAFILGIV